MPVPKSRLECRFIPLAFSHESAKIPSIIHHILITQFQRHNLVRDFPSGWRVIEHSAKHGEKMVEFGDRLTTLFPNCRSTGDGLPCQQAHHDGNFLQVWEVTRQS